ncbi:MAG: hypothetical protein PQJ60_07230 [Spirochaetales bacterium]|nr:hypothetical protein [Spirochaetales bacterium]
MAKKQMNIVLVLQILVALLLLTFGIDGLTGYNSTGAEMMRTVNRTFGGSNDILPLIFAIIEIVAGVLLIGEFFMPVATKFVFISMVVICVVWLITIVMNYITAGFLKPDFLTWLRGISVQLILLASFWQVGVSKK